MTAGDVWGDGATFLFSLEKPGLNGDVCVRSESGHMTSCGGVDEWNGGKGEARTHLVFLRIEGLRVRAIPINGLGKMEILDVVVGALSNLLLKLVAALPAIVSAYF